MTTAEFEKLIVSFKSVVSWQNVSDDETPRFMISNEFGYCHFITLLSDYDEALMHCTITKNLDLYHPFYLRSNKIYKCNGYVYIKDPNDGPFKLKISKLYDIIRSRMSECNMTKTL